MDWGGNRVLRFLRINLTAIIKLSNQLSSGMMRMIGSLFTEKAMYDSLLFSRRH